MSSTNYKSFLCNTDKIFACNFSDRQMAISLHGPLEEKNFREYREYHQVNQNFIGNGTCECE